MTEDLPCCLYPKWLRDLNEEAFHKSPLPACQLLHDCLFYPASRVDGDPVRVFGGNVHSFVYVDNSLTQVQLEQELNTPGFSGYRLLWKRTALMQELYTRDRQEVEPIHGEEDGEAEGDGEGDRDAGRASPNWWAVWCIFERAANRREDHGPPRFSLLYICDDGVAAYNSLFNAQLMRPAMLVLFCCPGYRRGGNWTTYVRRDMSLALTAFSNQAGPPSFLLLDGPHDTRCDWPHYDCSGHKPDGKDPLLINIPQSVGGARRHIYVRRLGSPKHFGKAEWRKIELGVA